MSFQAPSPQAAPPPAPAVTPAFQGGGGGVGGGGGGGLIGIGGGGIGGMGGGIGGYGGPAGDFGADLSGIGGMDGLGGAGEGIGGLGGMSEAKLEALLQQLGPDALAGLLGLGGLGGGFGGFEQFASLGQGPMGEQGVGPMGPGGMGPMQSPQVPEVDFDPGRLATGNEVAQQQMAQDPAGQQKPPVHMPDADNLLDTIQSPKFGDFAKPIQQEMYRQHTANFKETIDHLQSNEGRMNPRARNELGKLQSSYDALYNSFKGKNTTTPINEQTYHKEIATLADQAREFNWEASVVQEGQNPGDITMDPKTGNYMQRQADGTMERIQHDPQFMAENGIVPSKIGGAFHVMERGEYVTKSASEVLGDQAVTPESFLKMQDGVLDEMRGQYDKQMGIFQDAQRLGDPNAANLHPGEFAPDPAAIQQQVIQRLQAGIEGAKAANLALSGQGEQHGQHLPQQMQQDSRPFEQLPSHERMMQFDAAANPLRERNPVTGRMEQDFTQAGEMLSAEGAIPGGQHDQMRKRLGEQLLRNDEGQLMPRSQTETFGPNKDYLQEGQVNMYDEHGNPIKSRVFPRHQSERQVAERWMGAKPDTLPDEVLKNMGFHPGESQSGYPSDSGVGGMAEREFSVQDRGTGEITDPRGGRFGGLSPEQAAAGERAFQEQMAAEDNMYNTLTSISPDDLKHPSNKSMLRNLQGELANLEITKATQPDFTEQNYHAMRSHILGGKGPHLMEALAGQTGDGSHFQGAINELAANPTGGYNGRQFDERGMLTQGTPESPQQRFIEGNVEAGRAWGGDQGMGKRGERDFAPQVREGKLGGAVPDVNPVGQADQQMIRAVEAFQQMKQPKKASGKKGMGRKRQAERSPSDRTFRNKDLSGKRTSALRGSSNEDFIRQNPQHAPLARRVDQIFNKYRFVSEFNQKATEAERRLVAKWQKLTGKKPMR